MFDVDDDDDHEGYDITFVRVHNDDDDRFRCFNFSV